MKAKPKGLKENQFRVYGYFQIGPSVYSEESVLKIRVFGRKREISNIRINFV